MVEKEPDDVVSDSGESESIDIKSDTETSDRQIPEKEPDDTPADSEVSEPVDSESTSDKEVIESDVIDTEEPEQIDTKVDTEIIEEQVSEEKSEDTPADSEVLEPAASDSTAESQDEQTSGKEEVESNVADTEEPEQIDTTADTETIEEQVSEEKSDDTPAGSEVLGPIDSESAIEAPEGQISGGEEVESDVEDSEEPGPIDTTSDAGTSQEQVPEKELEETPIDQEVLETIDPESTTETPEEQASGKEEVGSDVADPEVPEQIDAKTDAETIEEPVSEEKLEDVVTAAVSEKIGPIGPKDDIRSRVKKGQLVKILLVVVLVVVIGQVGYFIFSDKQQITTNKDKNVTEVLKAFLAQHSGEDREFGIRNTRWGMTVDQVKARETTKIEHEDDTSILYHGEVAGLEASIYYTFREGILIGSMHHFTEKHNDGNNYIIDYKKIKDTLTREFGPPIMDEQIWSNDQNKGDPQKWGDAVRSEGLILRTSWEFKETVIGLGLYGDNDEIIHGVFYTTKEFERLLK